MQISERKSYLVKFLREEMTVQEVNSLAALALRMKRRGIGINEQKLWRWAREENEDYPCVTDIILLAEWKGLTTVDFLVKFLGFSPCSFTTLQERMKNLSDIELSEMSSLCSALLNQRLEERLKLSQATEQRNRRKVSEMVSFSSSQSQILKTMLLASFVYFNNSTSIFAQFTQVPVETVYQLKTEPEGITINRDDFLGIIKGICKGLYKKENVFLEIQDLSNNLENLAEILDFIYDRQDWEPRLLSNHAYLK